MAKRRCAFITTGRLAAQQDRLAAGGIGLYELLVAEI